MVRTVLSLRAARGCAGALEDFYREHDVLDRARAFDGCQDAVLLRATGSSPVTHLVIADWDGPEDYQRWVDDPWRVSVTPQLETLLDAGADEVVVGGVFEFVPAR